MRKYKVLVFSTLFLGVALLVYSKENIKKVAPKDTNAASGLEMYRAYCAVCHGVDGKGGGPAATAMKQPPTDLTKLAAKAGGEFRRFRVSNVIRGDNVLPSHGSQDMPMWGDVFRNLKRDESIVTLRVHNLTEYIASLQEK
ncbi:MAG TPA: cytochrome c [Bryobacteraceae bacterium]|nr:cytochrome c [Bryobacteraceae bacterium]